MPRVLVPLAPGFEEIEAVTIIDILRRADIEVITAALSENPVMGSHGITVQADRQLDEVLHENFDMVALPGGMPGSRTLREDARVLQLLQRHAARGLRTAAICAAPSALAMAGVLEGRTATSFPGFLDATATKGLTVSEAPVVIDGTIVTSRGVGTALEFALTLIAELRGPAARQEIEGKLQRPAADAKPLRVGGN